MTDDGECTLFLQHSQTSRAVSHDARFRALGNYSAERTQSADKGLVWLSNRQLNLQPEH